MPVEIEKKFKFDNDSLNEGMFMLLGVDMFKPTYRKEEKFEDEYTVADLEKWRDYINLYSSYGKKIYCLVHHEGGSEKPLYAGYLSNMRIEDIEFPVRGKNDLFTVKMVKALVGDILGIPKYIKDWIMAGGLPGRSLSFMPKKDKKAQKFFDEVSHLALLTPEETPFIKFKDLNKHSIEDLTVDEQMEVEQPAEAMNFSELNVVQYERSDLQQFVKSKDFSNFPDTLETREAKKLKVFDAQGLRLNEKYSYFPQQPPESEVVDSLPWRMIRGLPLLTQQQNFAEDDEGADEGADDIQDEDFAEAWSELSEDPEFQKNFTKWQVPKVTPDMRRLIGQLIKREGLDRNRAVAAAYEAEHKGRTNLYHYAEGEEKQKSFSEQVAELFPKKKTFSEELEELFPDKKDTDKKEELDIKKDNSKDKGFSEKLSKNAKKKAKYPKQQKRKAKKH